MPDSRTLVIVGALALTASEFVHSSPPVDRSHLAVLVSAEEPGDGLHVSGVLSDSTDEVLSDSRLAEVGANPRLPYDEFGPYGRLTTAVEYVLAAGVASTPSVEVPFDDARWVISGRTRVLTQYHGREALYLHDGSALLDGVMLANGVVEFHVAFSGERGFVGPVWHVTSPDDYEYFYIRPHQSGNPDANQYTPVFNGIPGWQLYHGTGYGTPVEYPYNEWIHVRVVFWEGQAQVFIDDMHAPLLEVPHLKLEATTGGIGLRAQNTPAYFSGFSYRALDRAPFARLPRPETAPPAGMILRWEVSSPFAEDRLEGVDRIDPADFADLQWQPLESEATGIANLARLHGIADGRDTVFARAVIRTTREGGRTLRFGYSDKVKVFVNGRAAYSGDNAYRSRDYRYLGMIGLFDAIHLPLEADDIEIWFAVTEAFGGWGIQACLC